MEDRYIRLVEKIAEKFGTTGEELWGVMLKQAPINGAVDLLLATCLVIMVFRWSSFVSKKTSGRMVDGQVCKADWREEGAALAYLSAFFAVVVTTLVVIASAQGIVSAFLNPEFWALKQVLK